MVAYLRSLVHGLDAAPGELVVGVGVGLLAGRGQVQPGLLLRGQPSALQYDGLVHQTVQICTANIDPTVVFDLDFDFEFLEIDGVHHGFYNLDGCSFHCAHTWSK